VKPKHEGIEYIAYYKNRKVIVWAKSKYEAQTIAAKKFNVGMKNKIKIVVEPKIDENMFHQFFSFSAENRRNLMEGKLVLGQWVKCKSNDKIGIIEEVKAGKFLVYFMDHTDGWYSENDLIVTKSPHSTVYLHKTDDTRLSKLFKNNK